MNFTKIDEAKRFLGIQEYPGNLFKLFDDTEKIINEKKIVLFKEDLDKLSGFIGYNSGYAIICINYNRSIGHQNFTLAHEIGHLFMHYGISKSDINPHSSGCKEEEQANEFAKELIYPKKYAKEDFCYVLKNNLMDRSNWEELGVYINDLCKKYCTSFQFTFNRLFEDEFSEYSKRRAFYQKFTKYIGKVSSKFPNDKHLYIVIKGHEYYEPNYKPYEYMKKLVQELIDKKDIGEETGESIICKYESLEGRR
ncbi:ImmA/IrrE family metallo-endopeptidase [Terrisporobacter petrolearius]|uniref:ImmA/IrrE family metallo-endopeptidase n=1 Tax=Terrisporobacter petrolearius TaxID=1460447 RepID=UPI0022E6402E|nr:ImmA/IrrE family metallo-endopeptidase [Terrisporobacter petrolearius]